MNYNSDPYFGRSEVSNSDLSWLKDYWHPQMDDVIKERAYKFGTLVDAMLTEHHKIDYFKNQVEDVRYTAEEFDHAVNMRKAAEKDKFVSHLLLQSDMQKIMIEKRDFEFDDIKFSLNTRCKWDLWMPNLNWGGDIKSTTATTQKQFEEAVRYFDYDRQRAWYMDIAQSNDDVLIGISKVNYKIFKVPIRRNDHLYNAGLEKYNSLAFKWWMYFES